MVFTGMGKIIQRQSYGLRKIKSSIQKNYIFTKWNTSSRHYSKTYQIHRSLVIKPQMGCGRRRFICHMDMGKMHFSYRELACQQRDVTSHSVLVSKKCCLILKIKTFIGKFQNSSISNIFLLGIHLPGAHKNWEHFLFGQLLLLVLATGHTGEPQLLLSKL